MSMVATPEKKNELSDAQSIHNMILQMKENVGAHAGHLGSKSYTMATKESLMPESFFKFDDSDFKKVSEAFNTKMKGQFKEKFVGVDEIKVQAICKLAERAFKLAYKDMVSTNNNFFDDKAEGRLKKRLEGVKDDLAKLTTGVSTNSDPKKAAEEKAALEKMINEEITRLQTKVVKDQLTTLKRRVTNKKYTALEALINFHPNDPAQYIRLDEPDKRKPEVGAAVGAELPPLSQGVYNRRDGLANVHVNRNEKENTSEVTFTAPKGSFFKNLFKDNFKEGWKESMHFMQTQLGWSRFTYNVSQAGFSKSKLDTILALAEEKKMAITWGPEVLAALRGLGAEEEKRYLLAARKTRDDLQKAAGKIDFAVGDHLENQTKISAIDARLKEFVKQDNPVRSPPPGFKEAFANATNQPLDNAGKLAIVEQRYQTVKDELTAIHNRTLAVQHAERELKSQVEAMKEGYANEFPADLLEARQKKIEELSARVESEIKYIASRTAACRGELQEILDVQDLNPASNIDAVIPDPALKNNVTRLDNEAAGYLKPGVNAMTPDETKKAISDAKAAADTERSNVSTGPASP